MSVEHMPPQAGKAPFRAPTGPIHMKQFDADARGPLAGVRVIDLSRLMAGNMLSLQLADFGADVIKVEGEHGDTLRAVGAGGISTNWKVYGRNKRSVCVDLRSPEGIEIVHRLVREADVFIESFKPGVAEQMGLGPEVLLALRPPLQGQPSDPWIARILERDAIVVLLELTELGHDREVGDLIPSLGITNIRSARDDALQADFVD